jgi:hypothetical protein
MEKEEWKDGELIDPNEKGGATGAWSKPANGRP